MIVSWCWSALRTFTRVAAHGVQAKAVAFKWPVLRTRLAGARHSRLAVRAETDDDQIELSHGTSRHLWRCVSTVRKGEKFDNLNLQEAGIRIIF